MVKRKPVRTRGKLQLSKYFQELNQGDYVAVVRERSVEAAFPKRIQGKTGIIEEKRGDSYKVKIKDIEKEKRFLIHPIHLKKIKVVQ